MVIPRRVILKGLGALPLTSNTALAGMLCTPPNLMGVGRCTVGVKIDYVETARQRQPHLCWAASISAIFGMHGHPVDQEKVVDKIFPGGGDVAAGGPQIIEAINGDWTDDAGDAFTAEGKVLIDSQYFFKDPDATVVAANQLKDDNGLIIGSEGHACVLTEMTYDVNVLNPRQYILLEMTVRDPWPGNLNKRTFRMDEAAMVGFLCSVVVAD